MLRSPTTLCHPYLSCEGILIDRDEMVADMHFLVVVCIMFLNGLPTVDRPCVRHKNRVLRDGIEPKTA
jgi:hypothetical protein